MVTIGKNVLRCRAEKIFVVTTHSWWPQVYSCVHEHRCINHETAITCIDINCNTTQYTIDNGIDNPLNIVRAMQLKMSPDCSKPCAEMTFSVQHNGHSENETGNMLCILELIHN